MKALSEPVHRKLLHHDCCVSFLRAEEVNLSEYNPRLFARSPEAASIYIARPRDHINICMEELTPDRFSIIRPNGSLLKSLHIL